MRDWGYAGDYVEAMWMMLQKDIPDDYVIATGQTKSVIDFLIKALEEAGLDPYPEKYVDFDAEQIRPSEVDLLIGDPTKAELHLGWQPRVGFDQLVQLMVQNDIKIEQ
jgi:GDPmannose 4,6-dehydratase